MSSMAKTFAHAVVIAMFLLSQADSGTSQQAGGALPAAVPLTIGAGDLIEISVYDNPDLSGRFRVNEKGEITVPLLGTVPVQGQTAEQVGSAIEKRYVEADILRPFQVHVSVFISEYATQGILVSGDVKSPGLFPALGIRMLHDVITTAGGVSTTASSNVIITRKADPDHPITVEYNPTALAPLIPRIQIFPGDSILVPRAGIVYVLGRVNRPGGYVLDGRKTLSVETAMALAGGSGPAAAMWRAHLVRTLDGGRKEDIVLNVNKIQDAKAPDLALKDGDILFVPTSNGKLIMQQAISSALNIGTSIAIYRVGYQ